MNRRLRLSVAAICWLVIVVCIVQALVAAATGGP